MAGKQGGKGRKVGREKRKKANKGSAISRFVRNKISAHQYFVETGQRIKSA